MDKKKQQRLSDLQRKIKFLMNSKDRPLEEIYRFMLLGGTDFNHDFFEYSNPSLRGPGTLHEAGYTEVVNHALDIKTEFPEIQKEIPILDVKSFGFQKLLEWCIDIQKIDVGEPIVNSKYESLAGDTERAEELIKSILVLDATYKMSLLDIRRKLNEQGYDLSQTSISKSKPYRRFLLVKKAAKEQRLSPALQHTTDCNGKQHYNPQKKVIEDTDSGRWED
jgi:hypothetical protein